MSRASVLILTLNEEKDLPACLQSVAWADDIVVFDSLSSDRTIEIARAAGARVIQREFDNYAAQRNAALTDVEYKNPWVLIVDADERCPPEMVDEIEDAVAIQDPEVTLYHFRRKDMFQGRWLRHSSGYPTWFGRLARVGRVFVRREINEEYHTDGTVGYLESHFLHYPFSKGIAFWFERHNRYSTMEAMNLLKDVTTPTKWSSLFVSDPVLRRRALKRLGYRLPARPIVVFLYLYIVRLGFLDRGPGLTYCALRMIYEYMIDLKVGELQRQRRGQPRSREC